jgi:hypothetical protein
MTQPGTVQLAQARCPAITAAIAANVSKPWVMGFFVIFDTPFRGMPKT